MNISLSNLRTSQLELHGQLSRLVFEYDADEVTSAELVNLLYVCGLPAYVLPNRPQLQMINAA